MSNETAPASRPDFSNSFDRLGLDRLHRAMPTTLQINVGLTCDLACHHCHVEAGPKRTETMDRRTADRLLALAKASPSLRTVDITGGAPELHSAFRPLVTGARALGLEVIDRCNLTVLLEPGQQDTAQFLANNEVRVVASLPCTSSENVDLQRGRRVFDRSIEALKKLCALGYGQAGSPLGLDLVYNPTGPTLPPPQRDLEARYHRELKSEFGIEFHRLLTIANMPIKRFAHSLARDGELDRYMNLLVENFNPDTVTELMCRTVVSVDHDGRLYDCDFNQALGIAIGAAPRLQSGAADPGPADALTIWEIESFSALDGAAIATAEHCYGCTAGAGSSCGGALRTPPTESERPPSPNPPSTAGPSGASR